MLIRYAFGSNKNDYLFDFDFANTTRYYNTVISNYYKVLGRYSKKDIESVLFNSYTLGEVEKNLKVLGYYLHTFRKLYGINFFYIIKDTKKNRLIYNGKSANDYINNYDNIYHDKPKRIKVNIENNYSDLD